MIGKSTLASDFQACISVLKDVKDESDFSSDEEKSYAVELYHELQRVLSLSTRTHGPPQPWESMKSNIGKTAFHQSFLQLQKDFDSTQLAINHLLQSSPTAVQPMSIEALRQLQERQRGFFLLDNSLRETTVGSDRGHVQAEKNAILQEIAKTGIQEVILGAFGNKINVDTQIASQWHELGMDFSSTWGFTDVYDFQPWDDEEIWNDVPGFHDHSDDNNVKTKRHSDTSNVGMIDDDDDSASSFHDSHEFSTQDKSGNKRELQKDDDCAIAGCDLPSKTTQESNGVEVSFHTPPSIVLTHYSQQERQRMKTASAYFTNEDAKRVDMDEFLDSCESPEGRIPLGLLMMYGHGICNAILELDLSLETFDYQQFDIVERIKFLQDWCQQHLPQRQTGFQKEEETNDEKDEETKEQDETTAAPRVLINLRDFTNYTRSERGLENALYFVDSVCRLPRKVFGFMMEEPTGYLFPEEVGKIVRMIRLTMDRAGHTDARFLVHIHMYFGMAEATQLTCLCNGADGVWAAVCSHGAQVGHACSTTTIVNLVRAGLTDLTKKFKLSALCHAARRVTEISSHAPCPDRQEVYGEHAFDIPYFMTALPSCRYTLGLLMEEMEYERTVRINEICLPSAMHHAMHHLFGEPEYGGWDLTHCRAMYNALQNDLLAGVSRNYNTAIGLGHLYCEVTQRKPSPEMMLVMSKSVSVPPYHPTVVELRNRWNRLALKTKGVAETSADGHSSESDSIMVPNNATPLILVSSMLPFRVVLEDFFRCGAFDGVPDEMIQNFINYVSTGQSTTESNPKGAPSMLLYMEVKLALQLFLSECTADDYSRLDDFVMQQALKFLFDEPILGAGHDLKGRTMALDLFEMKLKVNRHVDGFHRFDLNTAEMRAMSIAIDRINHGFSLPQDIKARRNRWLTLISKVVSNKAILEDSNHLPSTLTNKATATTKTNIKNDEPSSLDDDGEHQARRPSGLLRRGRPMMRVPLGRTHSDDVVASITSKSRDHKKTAGKSIKRFSMQSKFWSGKYKPGKKPERLEEKNETNLHRSHHGYKKKHKERRESDNSFKSV